MELAIGGLCGIFVGVIITFIMLRIESVGVIRVDTSDPDGPYLFLESRIGMRELLSKRYVVLDVEKLTSLTSNKPHE